MSLICDTPSAPYFAVIFTSLLNEEKNNSYSLMSSRMIKLLSSQDGFLGFESTREDIGITVSYWRDLELISKWKNNIEHKEAQRFGQEL